MLEKQLEMINEEVKELESHTSHVEESTVDLDQSTNFKSSLNIRGRDKEFKFSMKNF